MAARQVRALLMGGQACVFYGAAEFSRDTDLLILADGENLQRLSAALQELQAECIAVPPFAAEYLERGHAIHFRCHHPAAADMRVDLMSKLRGVDPFPALWERRTTLSDNDGTTYELLSLPDLVQAKKTQRSKDWPMLQRLVEAHYLQHRAAPTPERQRFWLLEMRTPELLREVSQAAPELSREVEVKRLLLRFANTAQTSELESGLAEEERAEREHDRIYWQPLKAELEQLRHAAKKT
ncbi:MAG: hypothetical protein HOP33_06310 [Verrucomicrobia bacterium]|nr:hypothetical protein [Verrucomicrobiota bacterium]